MFSGFMPSVTGGLVSLLFLSLWLLSDFVPTARRKARFARAT